MHSTSLARLRFFVPTIGLLAIVSACGSSEGATIPNGDVTEAPPSSPCANEACSAHGTCTDASGVARCACAGGYAGPHCDVCDTGLQDNDGDGLCTPACNGTTCSGHGVCSDASGATACACEPAYAGDRCAACAPGAQDHDGNGTCSIRCTDATCSGHGVCSDTSGTAVCTCTGGYSGPTCAACSSGEQDNDGDGVCASACTNGTCSGGGTCADTTGVTSCTCDDAHAGDYCEFRLLYDLDIDANAHYVSGSRVPYVTDARDTVGSFDRIAYRLDLDGEWVWTEMDPFSTNPDDLGVPVDVVFAQTVTNLTVATNHAGLTPVTTPTDGRIEFWSNCYGPGANGFDAFDDMQVWRPRCYGSMQVFDGAGNVAFAFNRFSGTGSVDLGIGNSASGALDWTFSGNGGAYTSRRLRTYVREKKACDASSCSMNGTCTIVGGSPSCACGAGSSGAGCGHVCAGRKFDVACSDDGNLPCTFYAQDGGVSVSCSAGSTLPYCDFTGAACATNGCVRDVVLAYDFGESIAMNRVRFRSDWWSKRPDEWQVWASDDPSETPGTGATLVYDGIAAANPYRCVTGDACTDEVPDACCPNGRMAPQDTVNVGTFYAKWDEGTFSAAKGRYWYFVVKNTKAPRYLNLFDLAFYGDDCVP